MKSTFTDITSVINEFIRERDWDQFQKPKDLALSLVLEATEILEHFQWKDEASIKKHLVKNKDEIADEVADTLWYLLKFASVTKIDVEKAFYRKLAINKKKYPIEKSKGNNKKYTDL